MAWVVLQEALLAVKPPTPVTTMLALNDSREQSNKLGLAIQHLLKKPSIFMEMQALHCFAADWPSTGQSSTHPTVGTTLAANVGPRSVGRVGPCLRANGQCVHIQLLGDWAEERPVYVVNDISVALLYTTATLPQQGHSWLQSTGGCLPRPSTRTAEFVSLRSRKASPESAHSQCTHFDCKC